MSGSCWQWELYMKMYEWDSLFTHPPQKETLDNMRCVYLRDMYSVHSRRRSPHFQPSRGHVYLGIYICGQGPWILFSVIFH
jgi:hypothetical protein